MSLLTNALRENVVPLVGDPSDHDALLDRIGEARIVLLGEATHGTEEHYRLRAEITRRLIVERGFTAVAVEADWPAASRVHRYVRGLGDDRSATESLGDLRRFPSWMWRNQAVVDFVDGLRALNASRALAAPVAFYGLDLYSLHDSIAAVVSHLERLDPDAAARARDRYACFEAFGEDPQAYGHAAGFGLGDSCEEKVVAQLLELQRRWGEGRAADPRDDEALFEAAQNARVVRSAEAYYRALFRGRVNTWNLRDGHMADTLDEIDKHLVRMGREPKIVVWAHNSHLGDARATEVASTGELNLGQLARERHGGDVFNVGFTTFEGTVAAASDWGGHVERKQVRPALQGSVEQLFHDVGVPRFFLDLHDLGEAAGALRETRLERAIGVVYRPETERVSHYFLVELPAQFDAVIHVDETHAVAPLEQTSTWDADELPETYPTSL